jgi:RNA polymerase sigma-70 factor (ECF subfamily)
MDSSDEIHATTRLVRAAQDGDTVSLDALLTRCLPQVRQIVALRMGWRLRQLVEIDDIVQEVLLDAFKSIDRFELRSEGSFRNWLARCVEREVIDALRTESRKKRGGGEVRRLADLDVAFLGSSIFGADYDSPSDHARARELAERLEDALLEMPDHERDIIVMRALCGMSYAELAVELGISRENTLRVAYSRALRKLEERLGL